MANQFQNQFMGKDNEQRARETVDSFGSPDEQGFGDGFGDDGFGDDTNDFSSASDNFRSRFSDDSFDDEYQEYSHQKEKRSGILGVFTGIAGALIATKLFQTLDRSGNISRMLGIEPMQQPNQGQQGQAAQGGYAQQSSGGGFLKTATTFVSIMLGIGIILVFVFYVASFFGHNNVNPSPHLGSTDGADLTPFMNRLAGKKNNNLAILSGRNYKEIVPYRYDKKTQMVYMYLPGATAAIQYDKDQWKELYSIDEIDKTGYLYVSAFMDASGVVTNVEPTGIIDYDKAEYLEGVPEEYKGLGMTKLEMNRISELKNNGITTGWFRDDSSTPFEMQALDKQKKGIFEEMENLNNPNKQIQESNPVPADNSQYGVTDKDIIIKPAEENKLNDPNYVKQIEDQKLKKLEEDLARQREKESMNEASREQMIKEQEEKIQKEIELRDKLKEAGAGENINNDIWGTDKEEVIVKEENPYYKDDMKEKIEKYEREKQIKEYIENRDSGGTEGTAPVEQAPPTNQYDENSLIPQNTITP